MSEHLSTLLGLPNPYQSFGVVLKESQKHTYLWSVWQELQYMASHGEGHHPTAPTHSIMKRICKWTYLAHHVHEKEDWQATHRTHPFSPYGILLGMPYPRIGNGTRLDGACVPPTDLTLRQISSMRMNGYQLHHLKAGPQQLQHHPGRAHHHLTAKGGKHYLHRDPLPRHQSMMLIWTRKYLPHLDPTKNHDLL